MSLSVIRPGTTPPFAIAAGGVTEIVLAGETAAALQRVLPMIIHLSHSADPRWLTWITHSPLDRELLLGAGVNPKRLRIIYLPKAEDLYWVLWDAMACGTSHAVIASTGPLPDKIVSQLDIAGQQGQTQGVLLRLRNPA